MKRLAGCIACALACVAALAQTQRAPATSLGSVTVSGVGHPVEKSYRKMVEGMDLFERMHALAPNAPLRFRLLPRKPGTNMDDMLLEVVGKSFSYRLPINPDRTFTLQRDPK